MISHNEFMYIVDVFCTVFDVEKSMVLSKSRVQKYLMARHFIAYYLRGLGLGVKDIGIFFDRDHTTILNSCKIADNLLSYHQTYINKYKYVKDVINKNGLKNNNIISTIAKDKVIYIAGKITGLNKKVTYNKFMHVQKALSPYAKSVINPITATAHLPEGTAWNEYMKELIPMLMTAEVLVFTPDSYNSKGARWEINFAREILQIPTIEYDYLENDNE